MSQWSELWSFGGLLTVGVGLIAATIIIAIGLVLLTVPSRYSVSVAGTTASLQLHVAPLFGIYPSICLLAGLSSLSALKETHRLLRRPWFIFALSLLVYQMLSIVWAPDVRRGIREIIYQLPFFLLLTSAVHLGSTAPTQLIRIVRYALLISVLQALAVVVFRISPGLERSFLLSRAASAVISSNALSEIYSPHVNVWDVGKAGGFFLYANPAACFMGICCFACWYVGKATQDAALRAVALVHWVAVWFTGSKAGILGALLVPPAVLFSNVMRHREHRLQYFTYALIGCAFVAVAGVFSYEYLLASRFAEASASTLEGRESLWEFAKTQFHLRPWQGLGYGGWERTVPTIGRYVGLLPHNVFILLWSQSGLLAVILGFAFCVALLLWLLERIRNGTDGEVTVAQACLGASLWMFGQAQGENFGLFGEVHMTPMLALLLGLLVSLEIRASHSRSATSAGIP